MMSPYADTIEAVFGNFNVLFAVMLTAFALKLVIVLRLASGVSVKSSIQRIYAVLCCALVGALLVDLAWISQLLQPLFLASLSYQFENFWLRIGWIGCLAQWQSLALFLGLLSNKKEQFQRWQMIPVSVTGLLVALFSYVLIFDSSCANALNRSFIEIELI